MSDRYTPDVARLICGNIDDLRCSLSFGASTDRPLLERCLAACNGREHKTKRAMLERALRKLAKAAAPVRNAGDVVPQRRWKGVRS
jgi:hypothetical protein